MNGSSPTVGAIGYLLGGGHSPCLGRSFGWAAEYISVLELVTADGQVRRVTAESEPELFFALRGTKGNFGIVTAVESELFPVAHIYGGGLWFAGEHIAEVLHTWREWVAELRAQLAALVDQMQPWAHAHRMVSFLSPDEATDQRAMRELCGAELYDRLARIKRHYDHANMFWINHNIEPTPME
jgi:FAD/FMN-containing dehydrogenase